MICKNLQNRGGKLPEHRLVPTVHRKLIGRSAQMPEQNVRIVRIDHRVLGCPAEEILRVAHEVLVDGRVVRDEHGQRLIFRAPRPSGLLPGAGDGARVADHQRQVQRADIDSQLEGVG